MQHISEFYLPVFMVYGEMEGLIDEKFFIVFRTESRELSLEVREDGTLIPNFPVQLSLLLLERPPSNNFIRDLECGRKLILEADEFV